jgi:mannose-1-phosphate guanylyltransferase/mannose-1-phosphate guanylyltransferase/phosphomannomutase
MKALVLAAGQSTRLRAVAGDLPKPLVPVEGRPILEHSLRWLAASEIREVWINLHYRGDQIRQFAGTGERFGLRVQYSEEDPVLGTAGAAGKLRHEWTETFLVVYGDNLVRFSLADLVARHRAAGAVATVALFDPARQPSTGIAGGSVTLGADGLIQAFVEGRGVAAPGALVNAGVYALEPAVTGWIPAGQFSDFGRDVFPRLLADRAPMAGHVIDGYCLGLDAPEPFQRGLALIRRGEVKLA